MKTEVTPKENSRVGKPDVAGYVKPNEIVDKVLPLLDGYTIGECEFAFRSIIERLKEHSVINLKD